MTTPTQSEQPAAVERTSGTGALIDTWPRLTDWFDALLPTEFGWRQRLPHTIRVEEFTRDGSFIVRAEMPGIDPQKDVEITIANGMLTIRGHRHVHEEEAHRSEFFYGEFVRTVSLPPGADDGDIQATYEHGILEVAVRMPAKQATARRIRVEPGAR